MSDCNSDDGHTVTKSCIIPPDDIEDGVYSVTASNTNYTSSTIEFSIETPDPTQLDVSCFPQTVAP